jgi:hypothetical protein
MENVKLLDLKKELKPFLSPSAKAPELVDVPEMQFLMIDGMGDPAKAQAYKEAMSALYTLAYTLKFSFKKGPAGIDYPVMASEGLWWAEDMDSFLEGARDNWQWTMMILQPELVTPAALEQARAEAIKKKEPALRPALERLRLERFHEGPAAQILHIGPYAAEGPNIQKLHAFIRAQGRELRGKHHEIYLSDPGRTAPEKLKTIIRQGIS